MRARLLLLLLLPAAAWAAAPTMIHTSAELERALDDRDQRPSVVVASGAAQCQSTLRELDLFNAVSADGEPLELLLLDSPELQAQFNLTSCHDLAFIDPAYAPEAAAAVAIDPQGGAHTEAEAEAEAHEPAPAPIHFAPTSSGELKAFVREMTGAFNVALANNLPFSVQVYWINHAGEEVPNGRLAANQTTIIQSFRGHRFAFRGEKMGNLLGHAQVARDQTVFTKNMAAGMDAAEACPYPEQGFDEDRAEAVRIAGMRDACNARRLGHNHDQPTWVHHFNPVPFSKRRVPAALWAEIQTFFREHRRREVQEGWPAGDCYTNAHEIPTTIVTLTDTMRARIFDALRPGLEQWIGGDIPLEPTSAYGIRLYHRGAQLFKHVDRLETHAVSAIINVAQHGLDEPWPLQIHDHQGVEHTVTMEPGDMVYYESASAVHGREIPLNGSWYANCFIHYAPTKDSPIDWSYEYKY